MDNIQLNFNGFSSRVFIEDEKVSATDISLSVTENILQFDGAYGGEMNLSGNNYFRLNTPSIYELPEISCSIGTEITFPQIKELFFDWLENRGKSRSVLIAVGEKNNKTFNFEECCYFKSLRLNTSQGSLVTANYDFYVLSRNLFSESLKNDVPKLQNDNTSDFIFDMDSGSKDKTPIGYWETKIDGFEDNKQVLDWSLNFNQSVIPKYYCGRDSDDNVNEPPLPDLMIGYPKMELSVNFLMDKDEFDKSVFAKFSDNTKIVYPQKETQESTSNGQLSLWVRGEEICRFLYGKVNTYSPSLTTNGAITFSATYIINQIYLTY